MAKTLNLKIKKAKLIKTLETALAERKARFENNDKLEAKYDKEVEAYNAAILKLIKAGKAEFEDCSRYNTYATSKKSKAEFSVTVKIPKSLIPKEPERPEGYPEYRYRSDKEAIENALRMLEMSDEEYVSAGTVRSVSEYL